jgi:hypothetical protein
VQDSLIPTEITSRQDTPMWLRTLHGLYMGRVYAWNGRQLYGLHFDYDAGEINESGVIVPDELLLVEHDTWLRGWTDTYKLGRFYDKAWWTNSAGQYDYGYERARQQQSRQQGYNARQERTYYAPPQPTQVRRDFMREFAQAGSPSAVKALYRALAKEFHPDLSGYDTTAEMTAINLAYERWK